MTNLIKPILFLLVLTLIVNKANAQDDLLYQLETIYESRSSKVQSTWKTVRLISGHSTRVMDPGVLNFVIGHRFGTVNMGVEEFWGLDDAQTRLGFEYGLVKNLNIGIGRSSYDKVVDGYLKYRLLQQTVNESVPLTLTLFSSMAIKTGDQAFSDPEFDNEFSQRLQYSYQLLIARKFSPKLSVQIMPSLIHRNTVTYADEPNDIYSIGVGGRFKISNRTSINAEYYPQFNNTNEFTNALSFGVDIETGGHVFQLHITNSRAMIEPGFIAETTGNWSEGDIHIGFNVARAFNLKAKSKKKKMLVEINNANR